jgi:hypothetical protein
MLVDAQEYSLNLLFNSQPSEAYKVGNLGAYGWGQPDYLYTYGYRIHPNPRIMQSNFGQYNQ